MTPYYIGFPILFIAATLDASFFAGVQVQYGHPSLVLVFIVSWALLTPPSDAIPWALMGGVLADLLSIAPLGASSLAYVLAVGAIHTTFGQIHHRNILFPPLAAALATTISHIVLFIILILFGHIGFSIEALLGWVLPSTLLNLLLIIPVFRIMGRIVAFFRPQTQTLFG